VLRDERGMTLIEILVSLMLLAIVSLALIQSTLVAVNANVVNELRDEAVSVAEQRINELRNTPFTAADMQVTFPLGPPGVTEAPVSRKVRGADRSFTINRMVSQVDPNNRQVTLTVTWSYKSVNYQHGVSTVLGVQ
jgi:prepilin-type N-terminal cleavage/methylation domain-containing protein